eukprot:CAMPEP_0181430288 /NCGR_PEP_ID=MMETSP1110-20121109/17642_1 /TAXON_ID=174948 /ORGANISM="Symbiodinium sp., Strain CCMP421" /LENGTH=37 /DNA_ID= /DNA_START= /DNA_END= /DNA_ORIENTATION=
MGATGHFKEPLPQTQNSSFTALTGNAFTTVLAGWALT